MQEDLGDKRWFTSDLHFGHEFISKLRGFDSVDEHDKAVLNTLLTDETKDKVLFMLGDFCLGGRELKKRYLRILGKHYGEMYFIWGNHDSGLQQAIYQVPKAVRDIEHIRKTKVNGQRIVMSHYPMLTWEGSHRGYWHLHGHCHGNLPTDKTRYRLDVGWDVWRRPISFFDVESQFYKHECELVSHHMPEHYDLKAEHNKGAGQ